MKTKFKFIVYSFFSFMLLIGACNSEPEPDIKVENAEAYAFYLDNSWEVNTSAIARNFKQDKANDYYYATIQYEVDLIKPDGDTVKTIYEGVVDTSQAEEFLSLPLDAQFELDSSYVVGTYGILFRVEDLKTNKLAKKAAQFEISMN